MGKRNVTHKDLAKRLDALDENIMERLDALENRTTLMSAIFLLYSIGIVLVVSYFSTKEILHILLGIVCYGFGFALAIKNKLKL